MTRQSKVSSPQDQRVIELYGQTSITRWNHLQGQTSNNSTKPTARYFCTKALWLSGYKETSFANSSNDNNLMNCLYVRKKTPAPLGKTEH